MDPSTIAAIGGPAAFAFLVIKEVMTLIRGKKEDNAKITLDEADREMLKDLHRWHNKMDDDGVPVWYVRKSLETAIQSISENLKIQTEILKEMTREFSQHRKETAEHGKQD